MDAICVSGPRRMMDSSTRWQWKIGASAKTIRTKHVSHPSGRAVSLADYPALEKVSESVIKDKQKFERLEVTKETLLEMFGVSRAFIS